MKSKLGFPPKRKLFANSFPPRRKRGKAYMRSDEYKAMVKEAQLAATGTFSKLLP
jgi:hypothetical protein